MTRKPAKKKPRSATPRGRVDVMTPEGFTAARLALNLYQQDLANELGITKNSVYLKESGRQAIVRRDGLALEMLLRRAGKWPLKTQ